MSSILLIDPATDDALRQRDRLDVLRRFRYFPHLGLMRLAQNSDGHEVRILDERIEPYDPATIRADLVGITVRTALAPRAHRLARCFHERGIPVVFGGPYPTLTPDRALADPAVATVVEGIGEGIWAEVLSDFQQRRLRRTYAGRAVEGASGAALHPRPSAYRPRTSLVQLTKGCNFRCSFCVVPKLYSLQVITPLIDQIVQSLTEIEQPNLFIVDDNFIADPRFARALCERLVELKKRWVCQATLNLACDEAMMSLMARAGCVMVNIGLETLDSGTWKIQNKKHNGVCPFSTAIARLHHHGILVSGGFVFGFDADDESVFPRTLDFAHKSQLDYAACHILTPYPGLPVYDEMRRDGRILTDDLSRYNTSEVVFRPRRMTPDALQSGFDGIVREFYSSGHVLRRMTRAFGDVSFSTALISGLAGVVIHSNLGRGLPIHA